MNEKMHDLYEEYINDMPQASKNTIESFANLEKNFNDYISSLQETAFWHGYMTCIKDVEKSLEERKDIVRK